MSLIGCVVFTTRPIFASTIEAPSIVYVPIDTRPVSLGLPKMLANIAGVELRTPPRDMLGSYLIPGKPEELGAWLIRETPNATNLVVSADMLGYGSLIASRRPGERAHRVMRNLRPFLRIRHLAPHAEVDVFGTVMRLAPTGLPRVGEAATYFAAGQTSVDITAYANLPAGLHSVADREVAAALRRDLGPDLDAYLHARDRNVRVDSYLLELTKRNKIDRLVLGQDDAGPVGLHLADLAKLRTSARKLGLGGDQASIEAGTDELGMALLARSVAHRIGWTPRVSVTYSRPGAQSVHDSIEFEPIDPTISKLIRLCGAERVAIDDHPDIHLFVYVAQTSAESRNAFTSSMYVLTHAHEHVTVADLSFIRGSQPEQRELAADLLEKHLAARLDGFASWNTNANTVGTALAAAIFTQAGMKMNRYDARAHDEFLIDRFADDYAYRLFVRPELNTALRNDGVEQTYLLPGSAARMESGARGLLWQHVMTLRDQMFPGRRICRSTITLPWQRTFETELAITLAATSTESGHAFDARKDCAI